MKKIIFILPLLIAFAATDAHAKRYESYISLKLDYVSADAERLGNSFNGFGGRFAGGVIYNPKVEWLALRGEAELNYRSMSDNGITINPIGVLFNGYLDFGPKEWLVRPYVGAGFGWLYIGVKPSNWMDSSAGLVFALHGGATFSISDEFKIDAGLRWASMSALDYAVSETGLFAGVRFIF